MKLIQLHREEEMGDLRVLYENAFPATEKKPFSLILQKSEEGKMEILKITDDNSTFVGLAIMILHHDLALLDYFAIAPEKRGGGMGSLALPLLAKRYAGRRMLLEIEDPEEKGADNLPDRLRRQAFYRRAGLKEMPYRIMLFGVQMRILVYGEAVTFPEYHAIFTHVFSEKTAKHVWEINS